MLRMFFLIIFIVFVTATFAVVNAEEYDKIAHQQFVNSILPKFSINRNYVKFESKMLKKYAKYTFNIQNNSDVDFVVKEIVVSNVYEKEDVIASLKEEPDKEKAIEELNSNILELKNIPTKLNKNSSIEWTVLTGKNPVKVKTKPVIRLIIAKKDGEVIDLYFQN